MIIIKKLLMVWLVIILAIFLLLFVVAHQPVCKYKYIDKDGNKGESHVCSIYKSGDNYCRLDVKTVISVIEYWEECK